MTSQGISIKLIVPHIVFSIFIKSLGTANQIAVFRKSLAVVISYRLYSYHLIFTMNFWLFQSALYYAGSLTHTGTAHYAVLHGSVAVLDNYCA